MGGYNFTAKTQVGEWEIAIDPTATTKFGDKAPYGYFENQRNGAGGGLWFDKRNRLVDADGTFEVPKDVIKGIRALGFIVPTEFE